MFLALISFLLNFSQAQKLNPDQILRSVNSKKACDLKTEAPSAFVLCSPATLAKLKMAFQEKNTSTISGLDPLLKYADSLSDAKNAAKFPDVSVTQSPMIAPSKDPHDYHSIMIYAWPSDPLDLKKPWVSHDGKINTSRTDLWETPFVLE